MTDDEFARTIGCQTLSCNDQSCAICIGWSLDFIAQYEADNSPQELGPEWADSAPGRSCMNCGQFYATQGLLTGHFPTCSGAGNQDHFPIRYAEDEVSV